MKNITIGIMACAAGIVVANNYYNQPLLPLLAADFHITDSHASIIASVTQFGYALGMLLLLPLGDKMERRTLISIMLILASGALLSFAHASNFHLLTAYGFMVGFCSIVPQILPTFAAKVAGPQKASQAIGIVMGGLLLGILLSRFVSGELAHLWGWQSVYYLAAGLMLALLILLRWVLPPVPPAFQGSYPELLLSMASLLRRHSVLRLTSLCGALQFGAFSLFWTTLAFYLQSLDRGFGVSTAGSFSLVGAIGALSAPLVGRVARRGSGVRLMRFGGVLMILAFLSYALPWAQPWGLIPGIILMDLGMQVSHVISMNRNFQLDPLAVSRLNTVYMVTRFLGAACGTVAGGMVWLWAQWWGVCGAGVIFCLLALWLQRGLKNSQTTDEKG